MKKPKITKSSQNEPKTKMQELPYRHVPPLRTVVEVPAMPVREMKDKPVKNYRNMAPVEARVNVDDVLNRVLSGGASVSHEELLALSPQYRNACRDMIKPRRIPIEELTKKNNLVETTIEDDSDDRNVSESKSTSVELVSVNLDMLAEPEKVVRTVQERDGTELQTWTVQDPILQYLESLPENERERQVFVGRESESLRVIPALVNGVREEEALLDGGSQIISISQEAAIASQIAWDPDTTINMQSANGQIEKTCGLARDVPFRMGSVTVYLQVHVVRKPAYRVLLGRPFDVLTESVIKNSANGDQMVIIKDPNTSARAALPTYARGELPMVMRRPVTENF